MKKIILLPIVLLIMLSCSSSGSGGSNTSATVASKIAGTFTGEGKYMPPNINLGSGNTCFVPNTTSYLNTGAASCVISEIDSTHINLTLYGSLYTTSFSNNYEIVANGNTITDIGGYIFTYYVSSKQLVFLYRPDLLFQGDTGCAPINIYYYTYPNLAVTMPPGPAEYAKSREVFDFSGVKN